MTAKDGKPCIRCGANEWYKKGACAPCARAYTRKWARKNKERRRDYDAKYREANKDRLNEYRRKWRRKNNAKFRAVNQKYYRKNREKILDYQRGWRERNQEKVRARHKKYYWSNHAEILERGRRWRKSSVDKELQKTRAYRKNNRDAVRKNARRYYRQNINRARQWKIKAQRKRRARKLEVPGEFSTEEFKRLCDKYGNKCLCCGRSGVELFADHVIPLSWEGSTNDIANIQPLCLFCNTSKGNRHATDYRSRGTIETWKQLELL